MANKIWHANDLNSAMWFMSGTSHKSSWTQERIPNPGTADFLNLPESMKKILRLDKPDLIATIEIGGVDVPVVSIELTTTTPQSQHAKQRVNRLVAAAEAGVPAIYIIPGRKTSGGSTYPLGSDLYFGINRIQSINRVPVFIYHYPDSSGALIHDPSFPNQPDLSATSMKNAFQTIDQLISNRLSGGSILDLYSDPWIINELSIQASIGATRTVAISSYGTLQEIRTADLGAFLNTSTSMGSSRITQTISKLPVRITSREYTLVFKPAGRLFAHGNDPYSGMLAYFDYAFCRYGSGVEERTKNLVYMPVNSLISSITDEFAPAGYHKYWKHDCPFSNPGIPSVNEQFEISHHLQYGCVFTKMKPLRILGYFSDMLIFQDSMLVF